MAQITAPNPSSFTNYNTPVGFTPSVRPPVQQAQSTTPAGDSGLLSGFNPADFLKKPSSFFLGNNSPYGALGSPATAAFGGKLIGKLTGGNETTATIGAMVGAIGGPIGIVVGGLAGSLLGNKKPPTSVSEFLGTTGGDGLGNISFGSKAASKQYAQGLSGQVTQLVSNMRQQGIPVADNIPIRGGYNKLYSGGGKGAPGVFVIGNEEDREAQGDNRVYFDPNNPESSKQGMRDLAIRLASQAGVTDFDPDSVIPQEQEQKLFSQAAPKIKGKFAGQPTFDGFFQQYKAGLDNKNI